METAVTTKNLNAQQPITGQLNTDDASTKTLTAYQVGDNDIVAHYSPEEAKAFLVEHYQYPGDDNEGTSDVELVSDALLDGEMRTEDGKLATTLRADLAEATKPCLLHSWE